MKPIPKFILQLFVQLIACCYSLTFFVLPLGQIKFSGLDPVNPFFFLSVKRILVLDIVLVLLYVLSILINHNQTNKNFSLKVNSFFELENLETCISSGILIGLTILFISNWTDLPYSFSGKVRFRDLHLSCLVILFPLLFSKSSIIKYLIYGCYLLLLGSYFYFTRGQAIFTDDHASVIYRLHLLSQTFPMIPTYNSSWNAGTDWRDFFATGILNVFLIFYLPIKLLGSIEAYRLIVPSILFVVLPASVFYSVKILGLSKNCALTAAFLSLTSSITVYKWTLSYGSLGFVCSLALSPLAFSSMLKLNQSAFKKVELSSFVFIICTISSTLAFFWSMEVVAFLPILLTSSFLCLKSILKNRYLRIILCIAIIFNLSWALLFVKASNVTSFLGSKSIVKTTDRDNKEILVRNAKIAKFKLEKPLEILKTNISRINPVITVFFIPALFLSSLTKVSKVITALNLCWLLLVGILGPRFKPQLELDRLLLIFSVISTIPIASYLEVCLENKISGFPKKMTNFLFATFIVSSTSIFASILQNRGWFTYSLLPRELNDVASLISENAGRGRAIFSGFVLHDLNQGHIAPIAQLTSTPLIASSPVHNLWWYTDVVPKEFREKGYSGVENYYDLMNVTVTLAHETRWKKYFDSNPIYRKVGASGNFSVYERKKDSSYFLSGEGEIVSQDESQIKLRLKTPDAVLKFTYFPFLIVRNCKNISEFREFTPLSLIKIENCSVNNVITIKSPSPLSRMLF